MIGLLLFGLVQALPAQADPHPAPKKSNRCRGIHMPNGQGGVNLLWTTLRGPDDKLKVIGERMTGLGARVTNKGGDPEHGEILVSYVDDLDARAIGRLLNQVDAGQFGPVTTEDFALSLDTLPADKCIRFKGTP